MKHCLNIFIIVFSIIYGVVKVHSCDTSSLIYQPNSKNEVKIEMEWMSYDQSWSLETNKNGYTGEGYLRAEAPDSMKSPKDGFMQIHFHIEEEMEYFIHFWCRHDNSRSDIEVCTR